MKVLLWRSLEVVCCWSSEPYGDVGTEALPAMTTQEIRAGQKEYPDISTLALQEPEPKTKPQ